MKQERSKFQCILTYNSYRTTKGQNMNLRYPSDVGEIGYHALP